MSMENEIDCEIEDGGHNRETKRQQDWIRKCVSNFSLYSDLVGDRVEDPQEQLRSLESGEFKPKLSKSAKKRLRKSKKKKKETVAEIFKRATKSSVSKKLERVMKLRQTKKDMKIMINKLSRMPL